MLLDLSVSNDRPVDQVFAYVRDTESQEQGDRVVAIEMVAPGEPRVGTQNHETTRMEFGRQGGLSIEITRLDPPNRLSISIPPNVGSRAVPVPFGVMR